MLLRALVAVALVRCVAPLTRLPEAAAGEAYYRYQRNTGQGEDLGPSSAPSAAATATRDEWASVLELVRSAHATLGVAAAADVQMVGADDAAAACAERAALASALIGRVAATGSADGARSLVELGSREGRLAASLGDLPFESVTLVDQKHPDSDEARAVAARRVSVGLEHLYLRGLCDPEATVCVAKHVCGAAMDYAIRAVGDAPTGAVALAPCCYFACEYRAYPREGRAFLRDLGFDERRFALLTKLTQWGPSAFFAAGDEAAGQMAMDVLDAGRVHFLLRRGVDAAAVPYAPAALAPDGTLESTLIVGWRSPEPPPGRAK